MFPLTGYRMHAKNMRQRFDRRILKDLKASNFSSVLGVLEHDSCYVDIATTSELMSQSIIGLARR
jgi:hypothetical protein